MADILTVLGYDEKTHKYILDTNMIDTKKIYDNYGYDGLFITELRDNGDLAFQLGDQFENLIDILVVSPDGHCWNELGHEGNNVIWMLKNWNMLENIDRWTKAEEPLYPFTLNEKEVVYLCFHNVPWALEEEAEYLNWVAKSVREYIYGEKEK